MTWTNENNDKFIYMFKLETLGEQDTFFMDKYQGMELVPKKTNMATNVSIHTTESMSIATIRANTPKGLYYLPNIDIQYTNEITKQFAFIVKSTRRKELLITNDKQLMMKIIKKIIRDKITRLEQLGKDAIIKHSAIIDNSALTYTYTVLYNDTVKELYQLYKTLNDKIKSL